MKEVLTPEEHELALEVGALVMSRRLAAGRTQQHVAFLTGLQQSAISSLERGRRLPSLPDLYLLASALGVPVSELLPPLQ
jgi:transcriptional regulator with XRE-family HTH domain